MTKHVFAFIFDSNIWSNYSGQEVLGPPSGGDLESHLFDAAKRAGAKQISAEEAEALYGRNARAQAFEGS